MSAQLRVRLQPRARADEIVGERQGAVVIRLTAPPIEGRANVALCAFIAERVGVARGAVEVVHGHRSRDKLVRIEGASDAEVRAALGLAGT